MVHSRAPERDGSAVPAAYRESFERARAVNPDLAERYMRLTTASDEPADAVMDALAHLDTAEVNRLVRVGMDAAWEGTEPAALRDFFREAERVPAWFDPRALRPGYEAFHEQ